MSTPNERDEAVVMLPDLALGILPAIEAERLMAIVRTSPMLEAELASLRGASEALAYGVPAAPPAAEAKRAMRDRLLSRATASTTADATGAAETHAPVADSAPSPTPTSAPRISLEATERTSTRAARGERAAPGRTILQRVSPFLALAASVMFALSVIRLRDALQQRNDLQATLRDAERESSRISAQLAVSDSLVVAMSGASVRVVEMVSTQKLAPGARMFWDRLANRWTLVTHDLLPAKAGRTYQLWLVTAKSEKVSAGVFNTDPRGRAVVQATYVLAERDLAAIAITEEPLGGSPQPTGAILVAGVPAAP